MTVAGEILLIGALFALVFLLALAVCLCVLARSSAPQLLALGTPWAMGCAFLGLRDPLALYGYYDSLGVQVLGIFFLTLATVSLVCMCWFDPGVRTRLQAH